MYNMDNKQKIKNIKDLEYNYLLNQKNIVMVIIGTAIIAVLFTESYSLTIPQHIVLIFLTIMGVHLWLRCTQKLNIIKQDILKL